MPPHMQRPEVLRAMMASPEVRQRIAHMAQQTVSSSTSSSTRGAPGQHRTEAAQAGPAVPCAAVPAPLRTPPG
jgi:hypothetical protein